MFRRLSPSQKQSFQLRLSLCEVCVCMSVTLSLPVRRVRALNGKWLELLAPNRQMAGRRYSVLMLKWRGQRSG